MPLGELPEEMVKKLPRYLSVPVARLRRLAVDQAFRGQKLGGALVWDAVSRAIRSEVTVAALMVDAKEDTAAAFYRHLGFVRLTNDALVLVMPLQKGK